MPTLLLSARQSEDGQLLWRACINAGWEVVRVQGWRVPVIETKDLALYGEPLFAYHIAQTLNLKLIEPPLDWLPTLEARWRGRGVELMTLAKARQITKRCFIKPASDKYFDAKIYSNGSELPAAGTLPENLAALVQEPVEWELEFRCFILNRKVMDLSPYWRDGQSAKAANGTWPASEAELKEAKEFCEDFLSETSIHIPAAIVIDVGIIRNRGWAVIESNAAFSSGIYGCDPEKVLWVLKSACAFT